MIELHDAHAMQWNEEKRDWYDATLRAAHYFSLPFVEPEKAAMLLCEFNPKEDDGGWLEATTEKTKPQDHVQLLEQLQAAHAVDPKKRTLRQWWEMAMAGGWKHHSWIDHYIAFTDAQAEPIDESGTSMVKTATKIELVATPESRDRDNYQACVDAGLSMPTEPLKPMPRGIGKVAMQLGIKRQTLTESVSKHIDRMYKAAQKQATGR